MLRTIDIAEIVSNPNGDCIGAPECLRTHRARRGVRIAANELSTGTSSDLPARCTRYAAVGHAGRGVAVVEIVLFAIPAVVARQIRTPAILEVTAHVAA